MQTLKVLPFVVVVSLFSASLPAQQVGDTIVVVTERAVLRSLDNTNGAVEKGTILIVKAVERDRFRVTTASGENTTVNGWMNRSDVVPLSRALDLFNGEIKRSPTARAYA